MTVFLTFVVSTMKLLFGSAKYFSHPDFGENLIVSAKVEEFMEAVSEIGTRIGGDISFTFDLKKTHAIEPFDDFSDGVVLIKFSL